MAAIGGHAEVARILLAAGADVNAKVLTVRLYHHFACQSSSLNETDEELHGFVRPA